LRRPVFHIRDDGLDRRLPVEIQSLRTPLVFPSIHRSESGQRCITVHALGNAGASAEAGGRPRTLNPTTPQLQTAAFRRLHEIATKFDSPASFEATHHGPFLELPSFFMEIGTGDGFKPPPGLIQEFARILPTLEEDGTDRVALAIGGGHYAPHFSELAVRRRWAFGHILSRHVLTDIEPPTVQQAYDLTPGAVGLLFQRAEEARSPLFVGLGRRLKDSDAERRTIA
jgi:D-aminoacyl-tRNA deacylase